MFMLHYDKAAGKNCPVSERLRAKLVTIGKDQSIFIGLICLHLLPIWLFPFFPTQDGISHVYNAHVLCEYRNPTYHFQDFYDINWSFFPNWLSHFGLAILMRLFSPLLAEKFFLSAYVILFPCAISYFINSFNTEKLGLSTWLSFFFIYNYLFLMGFYNYAVGVSLFFLILGFWWRCKEKLGLNRILILNLLFLITYFSHLVPYVFALGSIGLLSLLALCQKPRLLLRNFLALLLPTSLLLYYLPTSDLFRTSSPKISFDRVGILLSDFLNLRVLVAFDNQQEIIAKMVMAILVFYVLYSFWQESKQIIHKGQWLSTPSLLVLILFFSLFFQYLVYPNSVGPGGWLNDRIAILSVIVLLAGLAPIEQKWMKQVFGFIVLTTVILNLINLSVSCYRLNEEIKEFNALTDKIGENKVLLPLFFDSNGSAKRIGIFVNGASYYCLSNGGINLGNYEVQFDYFPINFKSSFQPPVDDKEWVQAVHWEKDRIDLCGYVQHVNYVLTWGNPDPNTAQALSDCYKLIHDQGRLKLYRGQRSQ